MFAAIRKGQTINEGEYMAKSTLLGILGRMVTYTGQSITWEQAMSSKEDLSPPKYEWGPLPEPASGHARHHAVCLTFRWRSNDVRTDPEAVVSCISQRRQPPEPH